MECLSGISLAEAEPYLIGFFMAIILINFVNSSLSKITKKD